MTSEQLLPLVIAQAWQVTALASIVWLVVRYGSRERSHLSHMLWTLVLIKSITPPIWSSPIGLFSQWNPATFLSQRSDGFEPSGKRNSTTLIKSTVSNVDDEIELAVLPATDGDASARSKESVDWRPAIVIAWIGGVLLCSLVSFVRFLRFMRQVHRTTVATPPEVMCCIDRLSKQLQLRQKVRVRVVSCAVGPAVYGFLRPVILLPQAIVMGRTETQLEPLIAHEMIHVRRGDLFVALVQSLACNLGWFHPIVWYASRCVTVESERCCDEETIESLRCKPSIYARSLLDVLERKHLLRAAPALPGVRPVDITSARLERIMRLGQGSRRRSPWLVWCAALVGGIAFLPGAHYVAAQPPKASEKQEAMKEVPDRQVEGESLPKATPASSAKTSQYDSKADAEKSTLLFEVEIYELAANSPAEKELTLWLEKQPTGSRHMPFRKNTPDKFVGGTVSSAREVAGEFVTTAETPKPEAQPAPKLRAIPILTNLLGVVYVERANSRQAGQVVQASTDSASLNEQLHFVTPERDIVDNLLSSLKQHHNLTILSAPKLMCLGGQVARVSVGETSDSEPSVGFSLCWKPTERENGTMILDYQKSRAEKVQLNADAKDKADKLKSRIPTRTREQCFSIGMTFDQSLVVVSRGSTENEPLEVVVVKCSKTEQTK